MRFLNGASPCGRSVYLEPETTKLLGVKAGGKRRPDRYCQDADAFWEI
ncbi:hypothetical protein PEC301296_30310 [Pectobacterium carotovorum subsp. carotovorum]|nr:hypothetical protein GZ59_36070 [Pectobacterium atrosepticum]POW25201.1 hypothetical protein PB72LOC_03693 [Pectobacterium atrosepticum]GKV86720.1 hypothetical protein PEC301296_30310 [Pectobacterium carotovorum subsp. carotovorum]